jgi:hypothetical protein
MTGRSLHHERRTNGEIGEAQVCRLTIYGLSGIGSAGDRRRYANLASVGRW